MKLRMAMPNWFDRPPIFVLLGVLDDRVGCGAASGGVVAVGIERAQDLQLLVEWRLRAPDLAVADEFEARVLLDLLELHTGVQCDDLHAAGLRMEAHDAEIGDHAPHASGRQATPGPAVAAFDPAGAGDEVHL